MFTPEGGTARKPNSERQCIELDLQPCFCFYTEFYYNILFCNCALATFNIVYRQSGHLTLQK